MSKVQYMINVENNLLRSEAISVANSQRKLCCRTLAIKIKFGPVKLYMQLVN